MNIRCAFCQTLYTLSRMTMLDALQEVDSNNLSHYDAHCPRCRRATRVPRQRLEMAMPHWREELKKFEAEMKKNPPQEAPAPESAAAEAAPVASTPAAAKASKASQPAAKQSPAKEKPAKASPASEKKASTTGKKTTKKTTEKTTKKTTKKST